MRNKTAKRIRRGMKPEQTKSDYKALKKIYKCLPITIKSKLGKLQNKALKQKTVSEVQND